MFCTNFFLFTRASEANLNSFLSKSRFELTPIYKISLTEPRAATVNIYMKIENEKLNLAPINSVESLGSLKNDQLEILELFKRSFSIADVVNHFFSRGQLVSFQSVLALIQKLLAEKKIGNAAFYEYFAKFRSKESGFFDKISAPFFSGEKSTVTDQENISTVPFLRSLNSEILKLFLQNSTVVDVPAGIVLCQQGSQERTLLVLLSGQASVFKKDANGRLQKWVVLNEKSLFGEAGFFFGAPRSATVVTDEACKVMVLKYIPEKYDELIKTEKARELQTRIWAIHALLKSDTFRSLPQECFDALIFSGGIRKFTAGTLICKQGDSGKTCYVIIQGTVNVIKDMRFVRNLGQGDSFGEIALTVTRGTRTASVQAVSETLALEIGMEHFYRMLAENLILACEFEKTALKRISEI